MNIPPMLRKCAVPGGIYAVAIVFIAMGALTVGGFFSRIGFGLIPLSIVGAFICIADESR